ncbi:MAG: YifB family Mg chelatase-like AAA ATPase [Pseudomonadota bacterium]
MKGSADAEVTVRSRTLTRAQFGMTAPSVIVETHLLGGLPSTTVVGMPEVAVREARDRVRSALANCGFDYPDGRVVVNLAPVDLAKEGARFDLAIAVSILRASGQLQQPGDAPDYELLGELGLTGALRAVRGCLCAGLQVPAARRLVVPAENAAEAAFGEGRLIPLAHLKDVVRLLSGQHPDNLRAHSRGTEAPSAEPAPRVIGQAQAKRALALAATGGHHLLMIGPPGTGKSLLARHLPRLLPELNDQEAMEIAAVYSAAGMSLVEGVRRPIRSPHHTVSATAMAGGGSHPRPGEISLAHEGVLFLDELPHFKPSVLDALREPLETREVSVARSAGTARFPARFLLLAAMNPCPAGFVCREGSCRCRPDQRRRYQARVSGPLLDRIDLHIPVEEVPKALLLGEAQEADPAAFSPSRVQAARRLALERQGKCNAHLDGIELERQVPLDGAARRVLRRASERYGLSARAIHRVMRVARTVADLESSVRVAQPHLTEALSYRAYDWSGDSTGGEAVSRG